jgi:hypothetical protein
VQVIMQAQKEYPPDFNNCKDKFLVQTVQMLPGQDLEQDTFKSPEASGQGLQQRAAAVQQHAQAAGSLDGTDALGPAAADAGHKAAGDPGRPARAALPGKAPPPAACSRN